MLIEERNEKFPGHMMVITDLFETCAGCPSPAEVDRDIVDFAVSELEGGFGSVCLRNVLLVQTFSTQVRLGWRWWRL